MIGGFASFFAVWAKIYESIKTTSMDPSWCPNARLGHGIHRMGPIQNEFLFKQAKNIAENHGRAEFSSVSPKTGEA